MKKTKERILDTALKLFNAEGLSRVTLRTIANEMEISQGNLNYHYKKREEIIEALYFQLVSEIDGAMASIIHEEPNLKLLLNIATAVRNEFYKYRFVFIDFVQIIRAHQKIRNHYMELSKLREKQFLGLLDLLIHNDILRAEKLPNEYLLLYHRTRVLGDFWISSAEITTNGITKKIMDHYAEIMKQSIFPYLTEKGEAEYLSI